MIALMVRAGLEGFPFGQHDDWSGAPVPDLGQPANLLRAPQPRDAGGQTPGGPRFGWTFGFRLGYGRPQNHGNGVAGPWIRSRSLNL